MAVALVTCLLPSVSQAQQELIDRAIEVLSRDFGAVVRIKVKVALSDLPVIEAELARMAEVTVIKD